MGGIEYQRCRRKTSVITAKKVKELVNTIRFQRKIKIKQHHLDSTGERLWVIFAGKFQRSRRKLIVG